MQKRLHAYFDGQVQGVGFRFTAVEIARQKRIRGWVKNLQDGRVEITAESEEDNLTEFLTQLKAHFSGYIRDVTVEWSEALGEFRDFGVRF
jgi:acylphosphatase